MDELLEKTKEKSDKTRTRRPSRWSVLLENNDYTPLNVVIDALTTVFKFSSSTAFNTAMKAQNDGKTVVITTSREMAQLLFAMAEDYSRKNDGGRLKFDLREED